MNEKKRLKGINVILKTINLIKNNIRVNKEVKNTIYNNKKYLYPGRYHVIFGVKTIAYKKNYQTNNFINKNSTHLLRISSLKTQDFRGRTKKIVELLTRPLPIRLSKYNYNSFKGELLMITHGGDIKVFDFHRKQVINVIKDKKAYNQYKKTWDIFKEHFNIPVVEFCDEEQVCIERYINFDPYCSWDDKTKYMVIEKTFSSFEQYFLSIEAQNISQISVKNILIDFKNKLTNAKLAREIIKFIPSEYQDDRIPVVRCNGDFNFRNILVHNKDCYFIDWEYSSDNLFFYDLMNFMVLEAINGDYSYIKDYLSGTYDSNFKKIFNVFDVDYSSEKRTYYLGLYILERIRNFEVTVNKECLSMMINRYLIVIDVIQEFSDAN